MIIDILLLYFYLLNIYIFITKCVFYSVGMYREIKKDLIVKSPTSRLHFQFSWWTTRDSFLYLVIRLLSAAYYKKHFKAPWGHRTPAPLLSNFVSAFNLSTNSTALCSKGATIKYWTEHHLRCTLTRSGIWVILFPYPLVALDSCKCQQRIWF